LIIILIGKIPSSSLALKQVHLDCLYPTLLFFTKGEKVEFDGTRTAEGIVDWVMSMTGPAVSEGPEAPEPLREKPQLVLYADSLLSGFEVAAKANRRKASWHFVKTPGSSKVVLNHKGEAPVELTSGVGDKASLDAFLADNVMPLFGNLNGETFDKYMEAGKGLVWSLFPPTGEDLDIEAKYRPMMSEVAKKFKSKYFVTWTDTDKFKEAIENMLSVTEYPAIAVQKKAGDKKKYVWDGDMTAAKISAFIENVEAGKVEPKLKSEPEPVSDGDEVVKVLVGHTMQRELFLPDKDVLLEVYAPWCGHCKKLEPEYIKLAKKIKKEELTDLLTIAKMDGTANDSPVESMDWSGFPAIYFVKAGSSEPAVYDGERTAKGLWKYIKKHATKANEIRERLERRKGAKHRGEEL